MIRKIALLSAIGTNICIVPIVQADNAVAEVTKITVQLGVSTLKETSKDADFTIPPSALSSKARVENLENSLSKYADLRNAYTSASAGTGVLASVTEAVIGVSAFTGFLPGVIVGGAMRGSVELGQQSLNEYAETKSRDFLVGIAEQLIEESGASDFQSLIKNPQLIEETLISSSTLLKDVRKRAQQANDPALLATVAASIAQVADEKAVAAYSLADKAAVDIDMLDADFSEFTNAVADEFEIANKRLDDHAQRLVELESGVNDLGTAVGKMQSEIGQLGRNQDLIADFVFTRMTPAERVKALQSGLVDKRIQCPDEAVSCDKGAVRAAMIARYSKEAEIQETLKSIGGVVENANTALKIANDLGLDVPEEVGTAVSIASAGFSAFANFASGNYLGAISSITGLFGGQKDPEAERHKQTMEFLRKNFEQVNLRLDGLRDGQTKIMDAIVQVSEQVHELHIDMDARFRALNFRLDQIDRQLRQLIWAPWASCNTISNYARFPANNLDRFYVDRQTLYFTSLQSRVAVVNSDEAGVRACMRVMNDGLGAITSLEGWTRFGTFVDLERSLLDLSPTQIDRLEKAIKEEGAIDYRETLPKYLDTIVKPSSEIVRSWASREAIDDGTLLYLLAAAPKTREDLETLLNVVFPPEGNDGSGWRFNCDASDPRYSLIGGAVCRTSDPATLMDAHLSSALDTSTLIEIAEWAVIISQILDLHDGVSDRFARDFFEVEQISSGGAGRRLIRTLAPLMNLGIAYENRLSGGLISWIVAEDIKSGNATLAHQGILTANPYLAENVAMLLLRSMTNSLEAKVSLENRQAQAILHSRSGQSFQFSPFRAIYGDEQIFKLDDYGRPAIVIDVAGSSIALPLPSPAQLGEGRFISPILQDSLSEARDRVVERLIDYELGADADLVRSLVVVQ